MHNNPVLVRIKKIKLYNYLCLIMSLLFFTLFLYDVRTTRSFIHPEVTDKYPKYLSQSTIKKEIGKIFDINNGEAAVKDGNYGKIDDESKAVSRSRNFNYFVDYLDALFTKYVSIRHGMVSHLFFTFLTVFFVFCGMRELNNSISFSLVTSCFIFCLSPILSMNGVIYRSGKIITTALVALLFYFFSKTKKNKNPNNLYMVMVSLLCCMFILADEMAVAFVVLCWIIKTIMDKKLSITLTIPLIWYVCFRFFFEPALALYFNNVTIIMNGGYSDFKTFLVLDIKAFIGTIESIFANLFFTIGAANYLGSITIAVIAIFLIGFFLAGIRFKKHTEDNIATPKYLILLILLGILASWVFITYLMALRHPFIIQPPSYGAGYYYMVLTVLFYVIFLYSLSIITFNKYVLLLILLFAGIGNFTNYRYTRPMILSSVMGPQWVDDQEKIQKYITEKSIDLDDPVYIKHRKFIESYHRQKGRYHY